MTRAKFGQNFLVDVEWQKKIVSYFSPLKNFAEIGPGKGAITNLLKEKYPHFSVFEIDSSLAELHRKDPALQVIEGDFLDWDFCLDKEPVQDFSLIGNLPYESGTKMLKRVAEHSGQISHFLFLLQREVVERMAAKPKTRDFGSLSILIQSQFRLEKLDIIPPSAFNPAPEVYSQLMRGIRREERQDLSNPYKSFLKIAFSQKRKTLRNSLKSRYPLKQIDEVLEKRALSVNCRAEEIEVDFWPHLFEDFKNG